MFICTFYLLGCHKRKQKIDNFHRIFLYMIKKNKKMCNRWIGISSVIGFMLLLSSCLIGGGIIDNNKYETAPCTLTKVSDCSVICVYVDEGGGGGGGGGDKRNVKGMQCKGAQFNCVAEWTVGNQTFSDSVSTQWWTDDYTCDKVYSGMTATVLVTVSDPGTALDIQPPGYSRPPILMIFGMMTYGIICVCLYLRWLLL